MAVGDLADPRATRLSLACRLVGNASHSYQLSRKELLGCQWTALLKSKLAAKSVAQTAAGSVGASAARLVGASAAGSAAASAAPSRLSRLSTTHQKSGRLFSEGGPLSLLATFSMGPLQAGGKTGSSVY